MSRPLHDYVKNRDSVTIILVHSDQYTPEFCAAFPEFKELPQVFQVLASNGDYTYVNTLTEVVSYIQIAGEGRGAVSKVINGMHPDKACIEAKQEYEYWQNSWVEAKKKAKASHREVQEEIPGLDAASILDDLDVDELLKGL